jgi:hypothetical protein
LDAGPDGSPDSGKVGADATTDSAWVDTGGGVDTGASTADAGPVDASELDGAGPDASEAGSPLCPYSDWVNGACAPVCGTANFGPGGLLPDGGVINVVAGLTDSFDWPLAVSAGGWVLHARGTDRLTEKMLLSVPTASHTNGYATFTLVDASHAAWYPPIATDVAAMSLDRSKIVSATNMYDGFREVALQGVQLGQPVPGHFAQVNASLPPGGMVDLGAVLSADELTFYYAVEHASDWTQDGLYVATRASASDDFGGGRLMTGSGIQLFRAVTGVSSDDLTLFLVGGPLTSTYILSRAQKSDDWSAAALLVGGGLPSGMLNYYNARPTADCRYLFATCVAADSVPRICAVPRL